MRTSTTLTILASVMLGLIARLDATPIIFTGTGTSTAGTSLSASATFDTSTAGHLSIQLTNNASLTSPSQYGGADTLTGLYFNIGNVTLTPMSVSLTSGSSMVGGTAANLPNNWGYFLNPGLAGSAMTGFEAVGATGLVTGANTDFTGAAHGNPGYLAGPSYGIVGAGQPNNGIRPVVQDSLTFQFSYTAPTNGLQINGVRFLYGTGTSDSTVNQGHTNNVPDGGSTAALMGGALFAMALVIRRRRLV